MFITFFTTICFYKYLSVNIYFSEYNIRMSLYAFMVEKEAILFAEI